MQLGGTIRNSSCIFGVSNAMTRLRCAFLLLSLAIMLIPMITEAELCKPDGPVLTDKAGEPIWLDNEHLLKQANHCVAPRLPAMARQARIEGQVLVDILVDQHGKVACAQVIHGHPMLVSSAIEAARNWTFRPMKEGQKSVPFYGHLGFYFSTGELPKGLNPCLVAHW